MSASVRETHILALSIAVASTPMCAHAQPSRQGYVESSTVRFSDDTFKIVGWKTHPSFFRLSPNFPPNVVGDSYVFAICRQLIDGRPTACSVREAQPDDDDLKRFTLSFLNGFADPDQPLARGVKRVEIHLRFSDGRPTPNGPSRCMPPLCLIETAAPPRPPK